MEILEIRDNPKFGDRYTVVYNIIGDNNGNYECLGMNASPFHPQGIGQHSTAELGPHLGKKITFDELPKDCQECVIQDLGYDPRETDPNTDPIALRQKAAHIYDLRSAVSLKNYYLRRHTKFQLTKIAEFMQLKVTRGMLKFEIANLISNYNRAIVYVRNQPTPRKLSLIHI